MSLDELRGWFAGRLPDEWFTGAPELQVDRDEIIVIGQIQDPVLEDTASDEMRVSARRSRVEAFREETRDKRVRIAREAQHAFRRKVSWGVRIGDDETVFTHLAAPAMTRLRMAERKVLDTLVDSGAARSRSDALAWCVRLVGQHENDWLQELREALKRVHEVRQQGPDAG